MMKRKVNEGRAVDIVYLDFSKAIDSIFHNTLIDKLKYGLGKWETCWAQSVVIGSTKSSWRPVSSAALQGWILGLILLNVFINDLDDENKCTLSKFADDPKLEGVLIRQLAMLLFRGTSTGWRNGSAGASWSSTKVNADAGISEQPTTDTSTGLGADWLESSSADKDLEVHMDNRLTRSQQRVLMIEAANCLLGCIK
ncbi:mitochondrial enolase superfamily member 1 [Grus japonensis]|uniref:Mitochondrial enolase superfamily member 1 n=1 Tax=Grus japonensis TaxID=30415 RepID=A0ABC9W091_GRUJA